MVKLTLHGHPEVDVGEVIHARCVIAAYEKVMADSRLPVPASVPDKSDSDDTENELGNDMKRMTGIEMGDANHA
jgi:hypothetical protein